MFGIPGSPEALMSFITSCLIVSWCKTPRRSCARAKGRSYYRGAICSIDLVSKIDSKIMFVWSPG